MTTAISRPAWLAKLRAQIEPVGECMEWQGTTMGKTPVVYVPADYAWPGNCEGRHSVRSVLHVLATGERIAPGTVIRMSCRNASCVHEDHFQSRANLDRRGVWGLGLHVEVAQP